MGYVSETEARVLMREATEFAARFVKEAYGMS